MLPNPDCENPASPVHGQEQSLAEDQQAKELHTENQTPEYITLSDFRRYWKQVLYLIFLLVAYTSITLIWGYRTAHSWLEARMGGPTFYIIFLSLLYWFPELPDKNCASGIDAKGKDATTNKKRARRPRLHYLDNIKTYLTICVYFGHCLIEVDIPPELVGIPAANISDIFDPKLAQTLENVNWFFYDALFGLQTMPMFFFISGVTVPRSFQKKGTHLFLKDKFIRLGSALLFSTFIFPIIDVVATAVWGFEATASTYINGIQTGLTWFLQALLMLDIVYVCVEKYASRVILPLPHPLVVFIVGFIVNILAKLESLDNTGTKGGFANFNLFAGGMADSSTFWISASFFFAGVFAHQGDWIPQLTKTSIGHQVITALLLCLFWALLGIKHFCGDTCDITDPSAMFFFETLATCLGRFIYGWFLLIFFGRYFNYTNNILSKMASASYGVYLFQFVLGLTWFTMIWGAIIKNMVKEGNYDDIEPFYYSRKPVYMAVYMIYSWPLVLAMKRLPFFREWL